MSAVDWHDEANCRGREADYWPEDGHHMDVRLLKEICGHCPVQRICLDWAMTFEAGTQRETRSSVYGGLTPTERFRLDQSGRFRRRTKAGAR